MRSCSRRRLLATAAAALLSLNAQADVITYGSGNSWLTAYSWVGGAIPKAGDVAVFTGGYGSLVPILANGATNNGAGNQAVGAIVQDATRVKNLTLGNNSTTTNLTLTLKGATVNGVDNVVLSSAALALNINNAAIPGNKTTTVVLDNATNNIIQLTGRGSISLNTPVVGVGKRLTLDLAPTTTDTTIGKVFFNSSNSWSGGTVINGTGSPGSAAVFATPAALPTSGDVTVNGNAQLVLTGAGAWGAVGQKLTLNATSPSWLFPTLRGPSSSALNWLGDVELARDTSMNGGTGLALGGKVTGSGGLATRGAVTLSGANTYTGNTVVDQGKLTVNGSLGAGSTVVVNAGATLGGTGMIGGDTVIYGNHTPGNSPGIQSFGGNLSYAGGSANLTWELSGNTRSNAPNPNAVFDEIAVAGNLDFADPTTLTLSFNTSGSDVAWADAFWSTNHTGVDGWRLFDVGGTVSHLSNLILNTADWQDALGQVFSASHPSGSFSLSQQGSDIYLNYTASLSPAGGAAVPEPASYGLAGLAGLAMAVAGRARRRRSGGRR